MKRLIDILDKDIFVPDNPTNFDIYNAIFGFVDSRQYLSCKFIEDECQVLRYNKLSKTWGNALFEGKEKDNVNV